MIRFLFGIVIGIILGPVIVLSWLRMGRPPVAVADGHLPFERQIVNVPMHARIESEMPKSAAIEPSTENLVEGAKVYRDQCASCHGLRGQPSDFANQMFPTAPQLWQLHQDGKRVGVSDDPPGETYWKVANGLRLTGMPAFNKILTDTQIWQVTLLLANADKPMPSAVSNLVDGSMATNSRESITSMKGVHK